MGVFINMSFQLNGTIHVSLTQPVNGDTKEYVHRKRFRDLPAGYYSDYYDASDSNPLANFRDPTQRVSQRIGIPGPGGGG